MSSVIVIGGGILGVSTAWRLAEAGHKTIVVESNEIGSGATHASFAWLNSSRKPPISYHRLNVAGMNHYRRLRVELDNPRWLHFSGQIEWDATPNGPAGLRERISGLSKWEYGSEILPISELKNLEPGLVAPESVEEFAYFSQEGYIEPIDMLGDLVRRAAQLGVEFRTHTTVSGFVKRGEKIQGVTTSDGEEIRADTIVLSTGSVAPDLLEKVGFELPMAPTRGLVAISSPSTARLRAVFHSHNLNMRPDGAGRVMMRHYDFDDMLTATTKEAPTPDFLVELLSRASTVLPELSSSRIEEARITVRPIPADGKPVVGPVPGAEGLYMMVCHSGVTLGPLLGHIAAREISTGFQDSRLADFRPGRSIDAPDQPIKEN